MASLLEGRQRDPVFLSQSAPTVLLDSDFVIRAATPSYLSSTGRHEDELVAVNLFEAFPENPATPEARSAATLTDWIETVLRTSQPGYLTPLRYDIPDPARPGEYLERRWALVSTAIQDRDTVHGVSIRVEDVTLVDERLLEAIRGYRDLLADGDLRTSAARARVEGADAFLAMVESHSRLAAEVSDLRRALKTRPTIDQAKGIVMADRGCTPDEAFSVLRRLSNDSNVRVADVAAAMVYQATRR
jgi:hypothetical protein